MTREEAIFTIEYRDGIMNYGETEQLAKALDMAIEALKQEPIDKPAMLYDIYMEGVNMTGEYQGCWVRFKNIVKLVNKYIT